MEEAAGPHPRLHLTGLVRGAVLVGAADEDGTADETTSDMSGSGALPSDRDPLAIR